ncbi:cilia- and flagella-associated protein 57 [Prorops nasuta]|uniref:cilia- and flagella-associated protein 57 n=1 Tax=Prorops nasuta TaxID=863751 RepID=UPI0034CF968A
MQTPSLQSKVIYGLRPEIIGNVHYISDSEIIYPVGNVLAIHNIPEQRQKLIHLSNKIKVNIMCLAPNKRYIALAEEGEKPLISIYDLQTLKRKRALGIPYETSNVHKFNCLDFTFDSTYLAAVTGGEDQTMLFYHWDKGKVESSIKVGNPHNVLIKVDLITCNSGDAGVLAVGGIYNFKFLTVADTVWRPYGFSKADNLLICSMAWISLDRLLAGTKDGRILYLENGDLKNIYKMSETLSMSLKIREEYVMQTGSTKIPLDHVDSMNWEYEIKSLMACSKGFAFGFGARTIVFFEKEEVHKYSKRNIYIIPQQPIKDEKPELYVINTINFSPNYDRLIITTGWTQIFYTFLWGADIRVQPEGQYLEVILQNLHYGPISGLTISAWKPIFMTCGEADRTVRLWNYETGNLILMKHYADDIYSIALHPIGFFCLIGFSDKLRIMSILIDDLMQMCEFPIRNCRTVEFSHGAHQFAAVNGNIVQIYNTINFCHEFVLKGHTGKVKALVWSQNDLKLLTIGSEGSVYEWDMTTGYRLIEIVFKKVQLNDAAFISDASSLYCISNDQTISEFKDGLNMFEYSLPDTKIRGMVLGKDDSCFFINCSGGAILSLKCPLQDPIEVSSVHLHCADVTKIILSYNEDCLISTGIDGSLSIWKVHNPDTKVVRIDDKMIMNRVLVYKGDMEEKKNKIIDLSFRLKELESEYTYKMRQTEVKHNDVLRELHQNYTQTIEELKDKIDTLHEERSNELNSINVEITRMKLAHEEKMKQMESNYEAKLIVEYDKYSTFEERNDQMRRDYENRLAELNKSTMEELDKTIAKFEARLEEKNLQLREIQEEMAHQARIYEKITVQIEEDADKEILELRTNYETLLYEEKQTNLKLKGEAGVMRNKFLAGQKDIEELKRQILNVQSQYDEYRKTIFDLEKDVGDLKREINERDLTINGKEQQIYDLNRTNKELEKFKFVLNYKIEELKSQIDPRDQEIRALKSKVRDMEEELVNLHKTNMNLELELGKFREKLNAAKREVKKELEHERRCQLLLRKIRMDLLDAVRLIQEPQALKTAVSNLYKKYTSSDEFLRSRKVDLEAQCEFAKQRNHLERTVESLKKQTYHKKPSKPKDDKILTENVELIAEVNVLREGLLEARKYTTELERILGLAVEETPATAKIKLKKLCEDHEKLYNEYSERMEQCERVIQTFKDELQRYLNKHQSTEQKE